jgi:hypothetical protein
MLHSFVYAFQVHISACEVDLCRHGMARPQVPDGGDALQYGVCEYSE